VTKRILLAVAVLGFSTSALAAAPAGPFYGSAHLGLSIFHDSDVSGGGGTATISYKMGFGAGAAVGYRFTENLRAEAEFVYKGASMDKVSAGGGSLTLSSSTLSAYGFMANAYYDITQVKWPVTPFVGVGLGAIYGKFKSDQLGTNDHDTEFGYQATLGVLYPVNSQLGVSGAYRYQGSSDFSKNGASLSYGSSTIQVGLNYFF
jgi:OmpA-OmpF porin, OOP family